MSRTGRHQFCFFDCRASAVKQEDSRRRRPPWVAQSASPQEVASLVAYVASPLASATTGAALRVDGGVVKSAS